MKASKSKGSACPLALPDASASRSADVSVYCSSRRRRPARMTSLADRYRPDPTWLAMNPTKWSSRLTEVFTDMPLTYQFLV